MGEPEGCGRPWGRAFAWLAFLGPFFFLTYGFANHVAAQRADVASLVFAWERSIPFVAWTIVPYWSIDLFYAISVPLCRTRKELTVHVRRLISAQIVAVACFLLFPLAFTFDRPATGGLFGAMFDVLGGFDEPFNQAPSLHIALLIILWARFALHLRPGPRIALHLWFTLIGISVLTTYQHHFVDIPTGLLLGWLCLWAWPEAAPSPLDSARLATDSRRWRLAGLYALGAGSCAATAVTIGGGALWLWWPAVSLAMVATNYAVLGVAGFQKGPDGRLGLAARWLLAPYLLGAWVNSRLWTRSTAEPVMVADGVWLARIPGRGERDGFACVVDVCAELPLPGTRPHDVLEPMLDLVVPEPESLRRAAAGISASRAHGRVLVCCALGYSRSALAVAAWLVASGRAEGVGEAVESVRSARPEVVLGREHHRALERAFAIEDPGRGASETA